MRFLVTTAVDMYCGFTADRRDSAAQQLFEHHTRQKRLFIVQAYDDARAASFDEIAGNFDNLR